jgi:hypothetical protein
MITLDPEAGGQFFKQVFVGEPLRLSGKVVKMRK